MSIIIYIDIHSFSYIIFNVDNILYGDTLKGYLISGYICSVVMITFQILYRIMF